MTGSGKLGEAAPVYIALPTRRLERVEGWAMLSHSMGYVYRPSTIDGVLAVFEEARRSGRSVAPRGSGYSYGDTSLNAENIILDLTRLNRVLEWDPAGGIIRVEPGVTIEQLWRYVLGDGWWPAVVPGTMNPTIGGCVAANVHGKNNWCVGTIGDHVDELTILLASGETVTCSRDLNQELFRAAIGGLGLLGVIVSITLRLKRVNSGLLSVGQIAVSSLEHMFLLFEERRGGADYMVGWIDAFSANASLGRGLVQIANHLSDESGAAVTLRQSHQDLPDTVFGVVPRSKMWMMMKPAVNDVGMRTLNSARYATGVLQSGRITQVPLAQFHFFHDYVPDWKRSFQPGGILQYQVFAPRENAREVFSTLLSESRRAGFVPYLAVFKLHRADDFLLRYNVDGYSLSLDYHATPANRTNLRQFIDCMTAMVVLPAGGRFYAAKDSTLRRQDVRHMLGDDVVEAYMQIKHNIDPEELLQSELYRRWFVDV